MVQRNSLERAEMLAQRRAQQRNRTPGISVPRLHAGQRSFDHYERVSRTLTRNDDPVYRGEGGLGPRRLAVLS